MERHHDPSRAATGVRVHPACRKTSGSAKRPPGSKALDSASATSLSSPGTCSSTSMPYRLCATSRAISLAILLMAGVGLAILPRAPSAAMESLLTRTPVRCCAHLGSQ
eukprot:1584178-Pyramimonas_sp.AAC.1